MSDSPGRLVVLDPTAATKHDRWLPAGRLHSLDGKVIGLLNNGKRNADLILQRIDEILRTEYGIKEAVHMTKPDVSRVIPDSFADDMANRFDAVVTGIGD